MALPGSSFFFGITQGLSSLVSSQMTLVVPPSPDRVVVEWAMDLQDGVGAYAIPATYVVETCYIFIPIQIQEGSNGHH